MSVGNTVCVCVCVYTCVRVCACVGVHVCGCMYTCILIHVYFLEAKPTFPNCWILNNHSKLHVHYILVQQNKTLIILQLQA